MSDRIYDISIIRPEIKNADIDLKGGTFSPQKLKAVKKALLTLHSLELMASTIYKFQITSKKCELNRSLIAAMTNEMTHYQDFQIKLCEYGLRPCIFRFCHWLAGFVFGFGSRLLGRSAILKTGIWVEKKAVNHYTELLRDVEWDESTRKVIEKNRADEQGHIDNWKKMLLMDS